MSIKEFYDYVIKEFAKVKLNVSFDMIKDCSIKNKSITNTYLKNFQKSVLKYNHNLTNYILYSTLDNIVHKINSDKIKLKKYLIYNKRAYDFI